MKLACLFLLATTIIRGQFPPIGSINTYGLHSVSRQEVLTAIGFKEGDAPPASESEAEELQKRVQRVAGVVRALVTMSCCTAGKSSLFVGIEEEGMPRIAFRSAPQGNIKRFRCELLRGRATMPVQVG